MFVTLVFASCKPDDGNTSTATSSLIGEWQLTSIVFGLNTTEEPLDECEGLQLYHYKENNNLELYFNPSDFCSSTTYTLTYTKEDNVLTIEYPVEDGFTYVEENTIEELNSTTLKYIEVWNTIDGDLPPEGRATYTYNRVN
tara:strand:- start:118178 stop:118600 length:423 start_codon:yes stop_codon:yes gene_type:complete